MLCLVDSLGVLFFSEGELRRSGSEGEGRFGGVLKEVEGEETEQDVIYERRIDKK